MKIHRLFVVFVLAGSVAAPGVFAQSGTANGRSRAEAGRQDDRARAAARERERMRFRAMDTDNDGVITRDEWRGSDQSFREHDTNADGVLSGDEVRVPAQDAVADRARREERLARFARADRNGDGRISFREWNGNQALFDRMDRNGDEFISRDEFMEPVAERQAGTSGSEVKSPAYKAGYEKGLVEGRQAGREDKEGPGKWDLEGQRELEQADSGYRNELGRRDEYQAGYRVGFRLGYREGFGPRR
jgi:Ca2+-binding EF-hand superfamily protein